MVNSPDLLTEAFLKQAYHNDTYNQSALPDELITNNLIDNATYKILISTSNFDDVYNHGSNVTSTVNQEKLNYYLYCDQYDTQGLVSNKVTSTIYNPKGGLVWN